ncbi:MAG: Non-specific serine/threonine protein kinase [Proteobacteria bacterium]|jgi:SNF2-related domain/Helicase conserved C-terminal domain|nr:Non-specific serine/threonine protein kinase [Pseudomonadota bacterium]
MPTARLRKSKSTAPSKTRAEPRLSRTRRPETLAVADWQAALRRQFGREQRFELINLGREPVFSLFRVDNPDSGTHYIVTIRGLAPGQNQCTCWDYATNHLGTCKHIEFTLARLQARRGGKAALARGSVAARSEIRLDYLGARQLRLHPGTACPPKLLKQARQSFDPADGWALPWSRLDEVGTLARAAQAAGHELRVGDDVWAFIAQVRDAEQRQHTLAQAYPKGIHDKALHKLLKARLYPYQAEGALFAARAGRALLGDEMGLGKTVQAIAAAELMARHFGVQRVLVVCPTSLKHQWKAEFSRFADRSAQVIHGLRAQRQAQYAEDTFCRIVNYEMLARDADLIDAWAPELVIADEAQRIKNWNTVAARALKRIASPYALVLTGTPLENRLEELISIVQFVDQHRLGPTWRMLDEHQLRDDAGRVIGYRALDRIQQTLAPVMLRRRKAEVLTQLPERVDSRLFVPLTPQQRVHHDENGAIVTRIVARWRKTGYLSDVDQRRLQCALQNMRMACNSTFLLDHETDHGHKADELLTLLDEWLEDPAAKVVVFSQWLGTHEVIRRRLAGRSWGHVLFHGGVPGEQRGALVERFHNDADCRIFLSTDAGGVGLNLQHAAALVVNMDLPWNPAVLEQRIGRVHRMGQSRGVQVVNLIGQGSIEEGMLGVLAFKKSLFAGVLDGGASEVFLQGTRLAGFMKSVEQVAGAMGVDEGAEEGGQGGDGRSPADARAPLGASSVQDAPQSDVNLAPTPAPASLPEDALAQSDGTADARGSDDGALADGSTAADPWANLLQAGAAMLQGLAAQRRPGAAPLIRIERDPESGQPSLRIPMPDPALLRQLAKALAPWLKS